MVSYRLNTGKGKGRIWERYSQSKRRNLRLAWFWANPSQILPTFCQDDKLKPWKLEKKFTKILFVWRERGRTKKVKFELFAFYSCFAKRLNSLPIFELHLCSSHQKLRFEKPEWNLKWKHTKSEWKNSEFSSLDVLVLGMEESRQIAPKCIISVDFGPSANSLI